jgi:hypothetical protein
LLVEVSAAVFAPRTSSSEAAFAALYGAESGFWTGLSRSYDLSLFVFFAKYGLVAMFPWGALAGIGSARADVLQGNTTQRKPLIRNFSRFGRRRPRCSYLQTSKTEYVRLQ